MTDGWISPEGEGTWVSVLIPAHNAQETVAATLDSVWKQTYRPIEVILIDDGSTDATDAVIRGWMTSIRESDDFTVRDLRQANQGLLSCRNRGTREARGEYVQYLDADDVLHPQKLQRSVSALKENDGRALVVTRTMLFRDDRELAGSLEALPSAVPWLPREISAPTIPRAFWYTPGPLFRRRIVAAAGPFPPDVHPVAEEVEFHARIKCVTNGIHYLPEVLAFHRVGRRSQLTGQLDRLYRGKVDAVRWIEKTMQEHGIVDLREWRGLIFSSLSTTYAIAACSGDRELFETSLRLARALTRRHGSLPERLLLLAPSGIVHRLCVIVHGIRSRRTRLW